MLGLGKIYNINRRYGKDQKLLIIMGLSAGIASILFVFAFLAFIGIYLLYLEIY